jgi:hypothetical protein
MPKKSMSKPARKHGNNVVELPLKRRPGAEESLPELSRTAGAGGRSIKRGPDDQRVKEAMRLAQAFLAIEDAAARTALIALAERLVSYDWVREVK